MYTVLEVVFLGHDVEQTQVVLQEVEQMRRLIGRMQGLTGVYLDVRVRFGKHSPETDMGMGRESQNRGETRVHGGGEHAVKEVGVGDQGLDKGFA